MPFTIFFSLFVLSIYSKYRDINILLNFIFSFFILKISLYIPINYIYGSAGAYLKFFNGVFPAAFSNFNYPIILFLVFLKLGFLKIATIFSGFIYLLNKKNYLFKMLKN